MYPATKTHALSLAITLLSLLYSAEAGSATCQPGWEWLYNSKGQNPCQIAGSLQAKCMGYTAGYVLPPLAPGTNYLPPTAVNEQGKRCGCNTIVYNLYMACTACQNSTFYEWSRWESDCNSAHPTVYPFDIPAGAAVPRWVYLDHMNGGRFDPNLARAAGRDPEATPETSSTVPFTSSTTLVSPSSSSTPPNIESTRSGVEGGPKMKVGVIVGGAVGGVAVLSVAVLVFNFLKRRRVRQGRVSVVTSSQKEDYRIEGNVRELEHQKSYDPLDPSTYPILLVEDGPAWDYSPITLQWPGRYNGTAEL